MTTSRSPGTGAGSSATRSTSGPPGLDTTIALMGIPYPAAAAKTTRCVAGAHDTAGQEATTRADLTRFVAGATVAPAKRFLNDGDSPHANGADRYILTDPAAGSA